MTEIKLKPCAHCGGKAALQFKHSSETVTLWLVHCISCYLATNGSLTIREAREEWNRRVRKPARKGGKK